MSANAGHFTSPYGDPWSRLTARCADAEHPKGCWIGTDLACRFGYQRLLFWIPGLAKRVRLTAHVATWCWMKWECTTIDELYLAYLELRCSGLELDHECEEEACRRPSHLKPRTHQENMAAGRARREAAAAAAKREAQRHETDTDMWW